MKIQQRAFTLVELSIVLVILGLLIGGVLTGQSLIRAAELRSVSTQHSRYTTAVHTFRDKYMALPGDMTNATSYWGVLSATPATCYATASTDARTCNGNGDGIIIPIVNQSNESFRFWQHLANAGLIEGSYDGITHGSSYNVATLENSPPGKIASSLWRPMNFGTYSGSTVGFDGVYDNVLQFGGIYADNPPSLPTMRPEETYNIDMKIDDGKPATGKVVAQVSGSGFAACTDTTSSANMNASYLLTSKAIACSLIFRQQF